MIMITITITVIITIIMIAFFFFFFTIIITLALSKARPTHRLMELSLAFYLGFQALGAFVVGPFKKGLQGSIGLHRVMLGLLGFRVSHN